MNRSARRLALFESSRDYAQFSAVLRDATERFSMRLLSYVIMPNHWHIVLWPRADPDLSAFMAWLTGTHVRRWHLTHMSLGQGTLYQGRYKAVAVQQDAQFYSVCRYVERNPVRAGLVARPRDWRWSSASPGPDTVAPKLSVWPVARPANWTDIVEQGQPPAELQELRRSLTRGRPLGTEAWAARVASSTGWMTGMRTRGRPGRAGVSDAGESG